MGRQQKFMEEPQEEEHHFRTLCHKPRVQGVTGNVRAQVLRSSANWSSGIDLEVSFFFLGIFIFLLCANPFTKLL